VPVAFAKKDFCGWEGKGKGEEREREKKKFGSSSYGVYVTIYPKKEKKKKGLRGCRGSERKTSEQSSSSGGEEEQRDAHPFGFPLFGLSSALCFYSHPAFFFFPADERKE
jgi:hypothetical protein